MFGGASNLAKGVDDAFIFIFLVSFIFIIGLTLLMIYILFRYNRKRVKPSEAKQFTHNNTLETIWIVIPLILVLVMFWYGWKGFAPMRDVPEDAMEITAIGRYWEWEFDYGNGKLSKDLVVPIDKAVKLNLVSEDVNHSLFIPAFRVKEDVVPGYNNYLWFTPTVLGDYDLLCTEYCGLLHSAMVAKTKVLTSENFDNWLENLEATGDIPDHPGLVLAKQNACLGCHSLNGVKLVGPSFQNLYGSEKTIITASGEEKRIIVDEAYLKRAIVDPNAEVVKGFNKGLMQSYKDVIADEDIDKIVDYLRTTKAE